MKQSCVIKKNEVVRSMEKNKKPVQFDFVKIGKEKTVTWPKEARIQGLRDRKD